ncbi:hypothetical protein EJ110_NYTH26465 [Nymphaea thermarum]|nr:hypothetical protein EJ110_NYTH26465 [Nymphaea thermarum]
MCLDCRSRCFLQLGCAPPNKCSTVLLTMCSHFAETIMPLPFRAFPHRLFGWPQWFTVKDRSHSYVNKIRVELEKHGCQIRTGCAVKYVLTTSGGCSIVT